MKSSAGVGGARYRFVSAELGGGLLGSALFEEIFDMAGQGNDAVVGRHADMRRIDARLLHGLGENGFL